MSGIVVKSFQDADELVTFDHGHLDLIKTSSLVLGWEVLEPGWRWSTHVKPIVRTERCEFHHISIVLEGRVGFETRDGEVAEAGPGTVLDIAPGHDSWVVGDAPAVLIDVQGVLGWAKAPETGDRVLATLLFTDIVGSTEMATRLGDKVWKQQLASHDEAVRSVLEMYRGQEAATTGDGFVATFDAPAQAILCALAIAAASGGLGVEIRAGVHTGEIEMAGSELRGVAVHLAARIMDAAGPGEVFVSATTADLAAGARIEFVDRGRRQLKGFAGERQIFEARRGQASHTPVHSVET
jgi:class 3 adenylate cyclase